MSEQRAHDGWVEPNVEEQPARRDVAEVMRVPGSRGGTTHRPVGHLRATNPNALEDSAVGEAAVGSGEKQTLRAGGPVDIPRALAEVGDEAGGNVETRCCRFLVVLIDMPLADCSTARWMRTTRCGLKSRSAGRRAINSPQRAPLRCFSLIARDHTGWLSDSSASKSRWQSSSVGSDARGMNPTAWPCTSARAL
jgi:hypothetical protein